MRHLDLFSGIGGFALAAQWMGWETVQFVEKDPFCQKVLEKNFKGVPIHGDIKTFDGKPLRGSVDIITGGFPCQPYSRAGKRLGKKDDRHLWPEYDRVIDEVRPSIVVGENVRGLLDWQGGLVFEEIKTSLETKGYTVAFFVLPACGKDAPHQRDRLWIIANSHSIRTQIDKSGTFHNVIRDNKVQVFPQKEQLRGIGDFSQARTSTNANCQGLPIWIPSRQSSISNEKEECARRQSTRTYSADHWRKFPTQPPVCGGDDGISDRVDRIKSLGNAIVPQVALEIFKAIEAVNKAL